MRSFITFAVALLAIGAVGAAKNAGAANLDWATPVLNALMCPLTKDPWDCGRQQAGRMIDVALADVEETKQNIKDQADADLVDRIAHRAFSESELPVKEKPSAVMTTLDSYVTNSIFSFMGRTSQPESEHMKKRRKTHQQHGSTSSVPSDQHRPDESPQHEAEPHTDQQQQHHEHHDDDGDDDDDDDDEVDEALQQFVGHHNVGLNHGAGLGGHRRPHHGGLGGHRQPIHHKYGRDLGGKQSKALIEDHESYVIFKHVCKPIFGLHECRKVYIYLHKVTRGKKHKKKFKKALLKLVVLAAVLKVKLEFFLKVLATHLQVKFFLIALFGLLLNAAKFWLDLKKGHSPQKVIYYEHAQHQHHYDDHGDDGWGGGGGYWKRSLDNEDAVDADDGAFEERAAMQAYRQSRLVSAGGASPSAHNLAYSRQKPAPV